MKNNVFFAQDAMVTHEILDQLNEYIKTQPDLHWAALIDSAFDYPASEFFPYTTTGINCYAFDAYEGLEAAAPWLMPFADEQQLSNLLRHCKARPMLSFVASRQPIAELTETWASLHWVTAVDKQRMLLRLADTRILPMLPQILSSDQWAAFTAPLEHWLFINREGKLNNCPLAPENTRAVPHIQLSQAQLDLLLQAAEADAVIDLIVDCMSDIIPIDIKNSHFFKLINESCQLAQAHQIEAFPDTVSLAVAACLTSGESNKNPKLHLLLEKKKWIPSKLGETLVTEEVI